LLERGDIVKRVLLTGMSGTGKSTLIGELVARGFKAVDLDEDGWSEWVDVEWVGDPTSPDSPVGRITVRSALLGIISYR
jgi:GTPase SAR1 family protein